MHLTKFALRQVKLSLTVKLLCSEVAPDGAVANLTSLFAEKLHSVKNFTFASKTSQKTSTKSGPPAKPEA